jgi:hypothetical protein
MMQVIISLIRQVLTLKKMGFVIKKTTRVFTRAEF